MKREYYYDRKKLEFFKKPLVFKIRKREKRKRYMNELTEFEKLKLLFDIIGIKYNYEAHPHTNQMKFFAENLYLWDVIDFKKPHYIELMVHNNGNDEVYEFNSAKEYIRFIMSYFSYCDW